MFISEIGVQVALPDLNEVRHCFVELFNVDGLSSFHHTSIALEIELHGTVVRTTFKWTHFDGHPRITFAVIHDGHSFDINFLIHLYIKFSKI